SRLATLAGSARMSCRSRSPAGRGGRRTPSKPSGASPSRCCSTRRVSPCGAKSNSRPESPVLRSRQLAEQGVDDRRAPATLLPLVADALVVDDATPVGRDAEGLGGGGAERGRLELVAVGGEGFQPVPQLLDGHRPIHALGQRL